MDPSSPQVVAIGADQELQTQLSDCLRQMGGRLTVVDNREELALPPETDLILLAEDPGQPERDHALCCRLQEDERTAYLPIVIIATGDGEFFTRLRAFVGGIVEVVRRPLTDEKITGTLRATMALRRSWEQLAEDNLVSGKLEICKASFARSGRPRQSRNPDISPQTFSEFKETMARQREMREFCKSANHLECRRLYEAAAEAGIPSWRVAHQIAEFTAIPYLDEIMPHQLVFGPMPPRFCFRHEVLPFINQAGQPSLVMANPFEWEFVELLRKLGHLTETTSCYVTEPDNIRKFAPGRAIPCWKAEKSFIHMEETEKYSATELAEYLLDNAVARRATDVHIEPKSSGAVVRLRIDGDLHDFVYFEKPKTAQKLISRFKVLGAMDIAESRQPQDGGLEKRIREKNFSLRLATTCTPNGECLKIRLLEPESSVRELMALGMSKDQCRKIDAIAARPCGMLLVVGPAGAGKTTTVYSILTHVPWQTKNIVSAENPIEYRIPFASQHQVNEKAGIDYETLLKASVRQDPDILFIGEIRDPVSARIAVEFASTGRLTLTTLHAVNATSALFRLECFGLTRGALAENIFAIVAQRLLKCLCPACKQIRPLNEEEKKMFACAGAAVPEQGGYPVGCSQCNFTGHYGRTGVFEILLMDQKLEEMVRQNVSQSEIRQELHRTGARLMSEHAADKVRNYLCSPREVIAGVFQEEIDSFPACQTRHLPFANSAAF